MIESRMTAAGPEQRLGPEYQWIAVETDEQRDRRRRERAGIYGGRSIAQSASGYRVERRRRTGWALTAISGIQPTYSAWRAAGTYPERVDAEDRIAQLGWTHDSYRIVETTSRVDTST